MYSFVRLSVILILFASITHTHTIERWPCGHGDDGGGSGE